MSDSTFEVFNVLKAVLDYEPITEGAMRDMGLDYKTSSIQILQEKGIIEKDVNGSCIITRNCYVNLILDFVEKNSDSEGVSVEAIQKYMQKEYMHGTVNTHKFVTRLLERGILVKSKERINFVRLAQESPDNGGSGYL